MPGRKARQKSLPAPRLHLFCHRSAPLDSRHPVAHLRAARHIAAISRLARTVVAAFEARLDHTITTVSGEAAIQVAAAVVALVELEGEIALFTKSTVHDAVAAMRRAQAVPRTTSVSQGVNIGIQPVVALLGLEIDDPIAAIGQAPARAWLGRAAIDQYGWICGRTVVAGEAGFDSAPGAAVACDHVAVVTGFANVTHAVAADRAAARGGADGPQLTACVAERIELAFLRPVPEKVIDLLKSVSTGIAVAVRSAEYKTRLRDLLEESQRQAEELQTQQEEPMKL